MLSQIIPGGPGEYSYCNYYINDTQELREQLFVSCLKKIKQIKDLKSIAFPYKIGCGIAQGDWNRYKIVIDKFASVMAKSNIEVVIIKRPGDE
jgi:hypothetical protein